MAKYTIKEGDTLLKIALNKGFKTKYPIYEANRNIIGLDPDLIFPGVTIDIPEKKEKTSKHSSGTENTLYCKTPEKSYLWLTLEDPGFSINLERIKLNIQGQDVADQHKFIYDNSIPNSTNDDRVITIVYLQPLKPNEIEGELVFYLNEFGKEFEHKIKLQIGFLDPIQFLIQDGKQMKNVADTEIAAQKMLQNLGYYYGNIDGDLSSEASFEAIRNFQLDGFKNLLKVTGKLNTETIIQLQNKSRVFTPIAEETTKDSDKIISPRHTPLFKDHSKNSAQIDSSEILLEIQDYIDPAQLNPIVGNPKRIALTKQFSEYPATCFVATSTFDISPKLEDYSEEDKEKKIKKIIAPHPNIIKNKYQKYVFLDCGKWKGEHASFGLIWGRHVYLCSYTKGASKFYKNNILRDDETALDYKFFKFFWERKSELEYNIVIEKIAFCSWGHDDEYDFDHLHVIIPDLHLLSPSTAKIWQGGKYTMEAELKLLDFSLALIEIKKNTIGNKLKVIQIGDSYDLWIDFGFIKESELSILEQRINGITASISTNQNSNIEEVKEIIYLEILKSSVYPIFEINEDLQLKINSNGFFLLNRAKFEKEFGEWKNKNWIQHSTRFNTRGCVDKVSDPYKIIEEQIKRIQGLSEYDTIASHAFNPNINGDFGYIEKSKRIPAIISNKYEDPQVNSYINYSNNFLYYNNKLKDLIKDWKIKFNNLLPNPASLAFHLLDDELEDNMIYLYGNHDNYLADPKLTSTLKFLNKPMKARKLLYQSKSLFVEHGHRCEYEFKLETPELYDKEKNKHKYYKLENIKNLGSQIIKIGADIVSGELFSGKIRLSGAAIKYDGVPMNYDGCLSGFKATCDNLVEKISGGATADIASISEEQADAIASAHDQPSYKKTFSRLKIGRVLNGGVVPNIFVIGHTHVKSLEIVKIEGTFRNIVDAKKNAIVEEEMRKERYESGQNMTGKI